VITEKELIDAIRQVAATEPDRVYKTDSSQSACSYLPNALNPCGCIVGEALALLGVPREVLSQADRLGMTALGSEWGSPRLAEILEEYVTTEALESPWVCAVQEAQDLHEPWDAAVEGADALFGVRP
jgi:hypothetical protein